MAEQRQTKRSLSAEGAGVSGEDSDGGDGGAGHTDGAKRRRQDAADGNETNIAVSFEQQQQGGGHAVAELEEKEDDEAAPVEGSVTAAAKVNAALFCTCTAAGDIAEWGACAADLTGVDAAGAVGRPMLELMVESDRVRARVADVLAGVVAGGGDVVDTYFFLFRRVVSRSRAIANASGDPGELGIVLAVHETPGPSGGGTALYVHEATYGLAQFRNLLCITNNAAKTAVVGTDNKNCVNVWSDKAVALTGFSRDEVMGKPLVERFEPEVQASVQAALDNARQGEKQEHVPAVFMTKDRQPLHLLLNANARYNEAEVVIGVIGEWKDGTQEAALRKRLRRLDAVEKNKSNIIAMANAPIIGIDAKNCVNEWNQKAVTLTGFSRDEAMGKPLVEEFIEPEAQASVQEVLTNALLGQPQDNYQFTLMTKDKVPLQVRVSIEGRGEAK